MKKFVALLLAMLMMFALCACGGSDEKAADDGEKVLVMATNAAFPPYEYYDGDSIVGIDAEIAQAICDKIGCKLEISDMEFNSIITAVSSGKADFAMAGLTVTEERKASVDFSTSYATGVQAIIVKEGSAIKTVDDIAALIEAGEDIQIGVQIATTGDIYCTDDYGSDHVQEFNKGADAVAALVSGKIDCVIIDDNPAKAFVEVNDGLQILDTEYITEDYAIAFAKDSELTAEVNAALEELIADGTVQAIIDKYISAD